MVPLLITFLACGAVIQLVLFHINIHAHLQPSPSTTTALSEAACTARLPKILSASSDDTSGSALSTSNGNQEVSYLVVYDVEGNDLGTRDDLILPANLDKNIDSRAAHEHIWKTFTTLIPAEDRTFVTEFSILSDGKNNILAGVSPTFHDPSKWTLKVDIVDARNPYSLIYSLLHEYGHLITLNASQVPLDAQVFYHPHDQGILNQAAASCPRYFTGEGCSNDGSYIDKFYNQFWGHFYAEWQKANENKTEDVRQVLLDEFYRGHEDQFLTSYAATSPQEDIAESWTYFVLSPKPEETTSIANQKILFFYNYPELVALRQEILSRLCASFPDN